MPYLGFYRVEFQKTVVIFEITPQIFSKSAPSNLANCKILQTKKCRNLQPNMPYLSTFVVEL